MTDDAGSRLTAASGPGLRQTLQRWWQGGRQSRLIQLQRENASLQRQCDELRQRLQQGDARDADDRRLAEASRNLLAAQEATRRQLASELHDRTSPNLAAIDINLSILAGAWPRDVDEGLHRRFEDTRHLVRETADSIRTVCADLRPAILDHAGLAAALESAVRRFGERTGIRADFRSCGQSRRLSPEIETFLYRIAQEALTNCAKHAEASRLTLRLDIASAPVALLIEDDGQGFDLAAVGRSEGTCGQGILNMCELARLAGGECQIDTAPGNGTRITVRIP